MANQSLSIPVWTSSKAAIDGRRLHLSQSRADLKRKLSETSINDSPIKFRKLRIEDLELQQEQLRVDKSWLDYEHEQHHMSSKEHRSAHRDTNQRIVSLGSDLWKEQEELRGYEEKMGLKPKLGPDSKGAFVHTLLSLYKDPSTVRKRSSKIQSEMKKQSVARYEASKGAKEKGQIWCCITQAYHEQEDIRAAHIVPHSLSLELADYIFGSGSGTRMDSVDNCLLIHSSVERAFDRGQFVLIPLDAKEDPILRWKIKVTDNSALKTLIFTENLEDLDDREVVFLNMNRPASRFLYYHFVVTLLRNKKSRKPGWEKFSAELPTGKPFATMGPYLRESMLLALAKMAGDLNAEEEVKLLGGEGATFVEKEKLSEVEEGEVARRAFEAHEAGSAEHDDDYDDDDDDDDDD